MEERETHLGTIVFPSREQILQMGVLTHTELQDTWSELLSVVAVPFTPEGWDCELFCSSASVRLLAVQNRE